MERGEKVKRFVKGMVTGTAVTVGVIALLFALTPPVEQLVDEYIRDTNG